MRWRQSWATLSRMRLIRSAVLVTTVVLSGLACQRTEIVEGYPDEYVGVGMELTIENSVPVVLRTLDGGAAQSVGVAAGDQLVAIDDKETEGITLGNAVMMLRGLPGSQVRLKIARNEEEIVVVVPRRSMVKGPQDYHAVN